MYWNGEKFLARAEAFYGRRVQVAGDAMVAEIRTIIGIQGPPRSSPGEAPHRDTGALWESIESTYDASRVSCRVGSRISYAIELEFGRARVAPRPFIRRSLETIKPSLLAIIANGADPPSTPA